MKNFLITLGLAVAACAVAFGVFYTTSKDDAVLQAARAGDPMAWLRAEFQLDDAQFAAITRLHEEYSAVCAEHCLMITSARERTVAPAELERLEKLCVDAMTAHFRGVAAAMSPAQGERYLATVLPRIAGYPHAGAPTVQVIP